jgi:predicted GNAT superfamily acetyltransferase
MRFENLTTLDQFREVERLEGEIWGPIDLVPVPIMAVSVRRGAVLVGAYDGPRLAGFVYSFPALRPHPSAPISAPPHPSAPISTPPHLCAPPSTPPHLSAPISTPPHPSAPLRTPPHPSAPISTPPHLSAPASHWSHMLGVHTDYRGAGLGRALKVAQRERVLALGIDLIEWTYDPLQALNAHLNFVTLGAIVEEYEENVYGESTSPLHGGLPTDRFVCQWWIARPHVTRRLSRYSGPSFSSGTQVDPEFTPGSGEPLTLVSHEVAAAPVANDTSVVDGWLDCGALHLGFSDRRVSVDIPLDYTQMLSAYPDRARRWRFQSRELFTHYFSRGYRVVDFALHREHARGRYLLTSIPPAE